jgi:hypothetical protein
MYTVISFISTDVIIYTYFAVIHSYALWPSSDTDTTISLHMHTANLENYENMAIGTKLDT